MLRVERKVPRAPAATADRLRPREGRALLPLLGRYCVRRRAKRAELFDAQALRRVGAVARAQLAPQLIVPVVLRKQRLRGALALGHAQEAVRVGVKALEELGLHVRRRLLAFCGPVLLRLLHERAELGDVHALGRIGAVRLAQGRPELLLPILVREERRRGRLALGLAQKAVAVRVEAFKQRRALGRGRIVVLLLLGLGLGLLGHPRLLRVVVVAVVGALRQSCVCAPQTSFGSRGNSGAICDQSMRCGQGTGDGLCSPHSGRASEGRVVARIRKGAA